MAGGDEGRGEPITRGRFVRRSAALLGSTPLLGLLHALPAQAAGGGPFPVTIRHKLGTTTIESRPKRVVTVGYNDQDTVLALGLTPVAVRQWYGVYPHELFPWMKPLVHGAPPVVLAGDLNLERIAALRPDLILAVFEALDENMYAKLSAIAPTVANAGAYPDFGMPREARTLEIGRALGRVDRARELLARVDRRFAAARKAHPAFHGRTAAAVLLGGGNTPWAYGRTDVRMRFLEQLGFALAPALAKATGSRFSIQLSNERLDLLEADILVWVASSKGPHTFDAIEKNPVYRSLDVVKQGHDLFLPFDLGAALSFDSVVSIPWAIDRVAPLLAKTLA